MSGLSSAMAGYSTVAGNFNPRRRAPRTIVVASSNDRLAMRVPLSASFGSLVELPGKPKMCCRDRTGAAELGKPCRWLKRAREKVLHSKPLWCASPSPASIAAQNLLRRAPSL
jgi:hypothetical protein